MKLLANLLKPSKLQYKESEWKLNSGDLELVYSGKPGTGVARIFQSQNRKFFHFQVVFILSISQ